MRRHAGRNLHRHRAISPHPAVAAAHLAPFLDDLALARARGTGADRHELPEHAAGLAAHLARAGAGGAALRLAPLPRAAAVAVAAALEGLELHGPLRAPGHVLEREPHGDPHVLAAAAIAGRARSPPPNIDSNPPMPPKSRMKMLSASARSTWWNPCAPRPAVEPGLAVAVVRRALLRIAQHLVRLGDLLEVLLGVGRRVAVGMVLHRELAIGLLDVGVGGVAGHAEQFVELAHARSPSTSRLVWSTRLDDLVVRHAGRSHDADDPAEVARRDMKK